MRLTGKDVVTVWQALNRAIRACSCSVIDGHIPCGFCRRYMKILDRIEAAYEFSQLRNGTVVARAKDDGKATGKRKDKVSA